MLGGQGLENMAHGILGSIFFPMLFFYFWLQGRNEKVALGSMQVFRINVCRSSVDKSNAAQYARMGKSESSVKELMACDYDGDLVISEVPWILLTHFLVTQSSCFISSLAPWCTAHSK